MTNSKLLTLLKFSFLFKIILAISKSGTIDCNPVENCQKHNTAGVKVSDPSDCHNYYLCVDTLDEIGGHVILPSDQALPCDDGYYFHINNLTPATSDCQKEETPCELLCNTRKCPTYCQTDFETIANPNDCSKYNVCIPNQYEDPVPEDCPSEAPYFNGTACTDNRYTCCDICTPYCSEANVEIPDPSDCKNYYLCTEVNIIPGKNDKFSCNSGSYFDPISKVCEPDGDTQCKALCS